MADVLEIAINAKAASKEALTLSENIKNLALTKLAEQIEKNSDKIFSANKLDLQQANNLPISMYNRLKLDENKLRDMIQGIKDISLLDNPINKIIWQKQIAQGIVLKKVSCPIGVIAVIFESRPDVITQITSLALKSSNAVILKGGSEALNTNQTIFNIIIDTFNSIENFPKNMVNLLYSRDDIQKLLNADEYIDLIIPRGSNSLVKYIKSNTKIPVLGHADGVCHIYVDEFADLKKAVDIIIDSKCQYPAACNSVETVLIHKSLKDFFKPELEKVLKDNCVSVITNPETWKKEYSDKILSVKIVDNLQEAINHINNYGSGHTDCIITENSDNAEKFMTYVDSAGVYQNISTRFADGFRYGFGAEVGISTNKTHARGPVGLEGLTIYKYKLYGNGDIVDDFIKGNRKFLK